MGISQVVRQKDLVHNMVRLHIRFFFYPGTTLNKRCREGFVTLYICICVCVCVFVDRCCKNTNKEERMFICVFCLIVFHLRFLHTLLRNSKAWKKHRNCLYNLLYTVSVSTCECKEHFA